MREYALRDILDCDGVAAAYVFGSEGRGTAGPLSDIEFGLWAARDMDARSELRLQLAGEAEAVLGRDVDVVVLDDAPPPCSVTAPGTTDGWSSTVTPAPG